MNPWAWTPIDSILAVFRLILASVFLASTLGKVNQPRQFSASVEAYHLLPGVWVKPFAYALTSTEIAVTFLLFIGWQSQAAALLSGLLLIIFILAVGINLIRGRKDLNCGCFGSKRNQKISLKLISRNIILLVLASCVMLGGGGILSFDQQLPSLQRSLMWEILLPLAFTMMGVITLYRLVDQLKRLLLLAPMEE